MKNSIKKIMNKLSDKMFIKLKYFYHFKKFPNLRNPKTYNEKLQWLKLYDRNEKYPLLVDKYEVKKHIAETIGKEYVIPTIGIYDSFEDIDFETLPERFVIKVTHDCGGVFICNNRDTLDINKAKRFINSHFSNNYYYEGREWPYKYLKPRIIIEQYMEDTETKELRDYKFFCFNGKVKALFIATDRQNPDEDTKFDFFDDNFNHLPFKQGHPNAKVPPQKPINFEKMKEMAAILSAGIPHVRVDFYEVNGKIYFGEMTFYHFSGFIPFEPEEWDKQFGEYLSLLGNKT